jgi:hypothetical protein
MSSLRALSNALILALATTITIAWACKLLRNGQGQLLALLILLPLACVILTATGKLLIAPVQANRTRKKSQLQVSPPAASSPKS